MTAQAMALPVPSGAGGLDKYLADIRKFPMLAAEEEYMLAKRYHDHGDLEAAHKLVTSHLRLVAKIAMGFRGYGLPVGELISEGNIGLMQAVKKFDPEKGFRLATYAMWWIRASIQEFILKSWSLVKLGTSSSQKKLFFGLRRAKSNLQAFEEGDLHPEHAEQIAESLGVSEHDVIDMNRRLSTRDHSLNARVGEEGEGDEWLDMLPATEASYEVTLGNQQELEQRRAMLAHAMQSLNEREQAIIQARRLDEPPSTLEELSQRFGVSRERIRQIENRAMEKLTAGVDSNNA